MQLDKVTPTEKSDGWERLEQWGTESVAMDFQYLWLILTPLNFILHKKLQNRVKTNCS
jgi:hypothetical protein